MTERSYSKAGSVRELIAAGITSLRAGRCADGEAFMAKLDAELAMQSNTDISLTPVSTEGNEDHDT
jgi:hypothetical protein